MFVSVQLSIFCDVTSWDQRSGLCSDLPDLPGQVCLLTMFFFARCYDGSRSIVFNCCLGLLASCERYLKVCCFLGYLDTSWYLRFEERLGYLNAETKEKFSQMARKKFKAMNGNTSSIIDMVQKAHFTNVFHYHDRHNVCLRKIGNCVSHRDFVVLVALGHSASSVLLWLCEMSQCHKQKLDFSLLLSRLHDE